MIIWLLEHSGGDYDAHYSEILGVFDTLESAKATYPNALWKKYNEGYDTWEWEFDTFYPRSLSIFPMELNKLHAPDYYMGEIK